jgi:glycosyltransferase involved in cell wall biosynthesis
MTSRRVLMTTDAVGGVWTYSLELARGLCASGVEVMLTVIGPPPDDAQRAEAVDIPGLVLVVPGLQLEWQDRAGPLGTAPRQRLAGLARMFEPDIVHCNGYREAAAGFEAPVVLAAHSCVRSWWWACRAEDVPPEWSAYADGVRAGLAAAGAVVAPSAAFLADLTYAWGHVPRSRVIHNGLDVPSGIASRRPVVLAAGRLWDEAKNVDLLAREAPRLPWPVRLAGKAPPDAPGWRGVEWLGALPRERLLATMREAAIFAAPARYEPFGLAILEAAASGCALVLGRLPTLVEVWGDAACYVPPGDGGALRSALHGLMADPAALARAQGAARARAATYSRRRMVGEYVGLYAELLERGHRQGCAA